MINPATRSGCFSARRIPTGPAEILHKEDGARQMQLDGKTIDDRGKIIERRGKLCCRRGFAIAHSGIVRREQMELPGQQRDKILEHEGRRWEPVPTSGSRRRTILDRRNPANDNVRDQGRWQMTSWTNDELTKVDAAEELEIAALRPDGTSRKPVTIWVVRVGQGIYVRSAYGTNPAWYRATKVRHEGYIEVASLRQEVTFEEADPAVGDQIDAAYRKKYRRHGAQYINSVITAEARSATIKLVPRRATA
jgi:hypothetical protein